MDDIRIETQFLPQKASGTKGTVTVTQGGETVFVDQLNIASDKARKKFIRALLDDHEGLKACQDEIAKQLCDLAAGQLAQQTEAEDGGPDDGNHKNRPLIISKEALTKTDDKLIECAKELLLLPDLVVRIVDHIQKLGVAGESELILTLYLIGTSRLLSRPLAGLVMGASSAGKSFVISRVSDLFPDETRLQAHRITPRALEYMPNGSLVHRFIVGRERSRLQDDAAAEATRALREMIGDGKLSLALPIKRRSGEFETIHVQQDGPIAYVESTTLGIRSIFDEDRTRFILLASDESQQQTDAVVQELARQAGKPGNPDGPDSIIALHHTAQRLLESYEVEVPYARQLIDCLPQGRLEVRRTFGHLLSFIKSVSLLHQFQRKRNAQGQLIATLEDYHVVRTHLSGPLARSLGCALTPGADRLLDIARTCTTSTVGELAAKAQCSDNTVRGRIKELIDAGQCEKIRESRGQTPASYRIPDDPPAMSGLALPDLSHAAIEKDVLKVS